MKNKLIQYALVAIFVTIGNTVTTAFAVPIKGVNIPIILDIHEDFGADKPDKAKKAVAAASKILWQAGYKLTVVKTNKEEKGDAVGGEDGKVDWGVAEYIKVVEAGKKEILTTPNKRGIKISFVNEPKKGGTTPGWAYHREPVIAVKNRTTEALTGETIAHEIAHILTLVGPYKIDSVTPANEAGHAPNKAGRAGQRNLMAPSNYRTGTYLTHSQRQEMRKNPFTHGKCSVQFSEAYPAEKCQTQYGVSADSLGDSVGGLAHGDLFGTTLVSLNESTYVDGMLSLGKALTGNVDTTYALAFNSDDNLGTGVSYHGVAGTDYVLEIEVTGVAGSYSASALVRDLVGGGTQPIGQDPIIEAVDILDGNGSPVPVFTQLLFNFEKALVGIDPGVATDIPVTTLAIDQSMVLDTESFVFDLDKWLDDPSLITFGTGVPSPGELYPFAISGLKPDDIFNFFLDEELIFTELLDGMGSFNGSFVFPTSLSVNEFHFLTAQDTTGEFAYGITCPKPVPAPPTAALLAVGLLGTMCRMCVRKPMRIP